MSNPAYLNINSSAVAFQDAVLTQNPLLKSFDWNRRLNGVPCENPEARTFTVPPRQMFTIFNNSRPTTLDGTTAFDLTFLTGNTYRFNYVGGTDPSLATDQALSFGATAMTVQVLANYIVTITAGAGTPFVNVTAGATLYINDSTDMVSPSFSPLNAGYWTVVAATSTVLTLTRPTGVPFQATSEVVAAATSADMIAFVPSNVQVGDKVRIDAGFNIDARQTYIISEVTSKWFKVTSSLPLANETGILPGSTGMVFYLAKRFVRLETNQRARVYFNGASDAGQELDPWTPGDSAQMAWQERVGPVWSVIVYNLAQVPMIVNVFSAE